MIKGEFYMISGSLDTEESDDVFDVNEFQLPNPSGKSGGACTSAILKILYKNPFIVVTWLWLLKNLRLELKKLGYKQTPQLSSSRRIDQTKEISFDTKNNKGTKRALLIGINYKGQQGELFGCHNDIRNIKRYLVEEHHFDVKDMIILMDDDVSIEPTRKNIENAFIKITDVCQSDDVVWFHYAGHGDRKKDISRDEKSGVDSTLIPVDFRSSGVIDDDTINKLFVQRMRANVQVSVITDCCHSGTILDLPYQMSEF
jgi:hypothetical protein